MTDENNIYDDLNIRHIKLTSGDEIIGLIAGIDVPNQLVHIERPMAIHSHYAGDKESYYLTEWMPVAKSNISHISSVHIIAQSEVTDDMKENYIRFCLNKKDTQYDDLYEDEEDTIPDPENTLIH
jgi:hypothetical protein